MKKIFCCSLLLVMIFAAGACADAIGTLSKSHSNDPDKIEMYDILYIEGYKSLLLASVLDKDFNYDDEAIKFYDSLTLMQLALNKGEIDTFTAPEAVGEYILRSNPEYKLRGFLVLKNPVALAFGFLEEKKELRDKFNKVIEEMEAEGKIGLLARDFITGPKAQNPEAVEFEKFEGAETINIAVTGDMPPLDYIDAGGKPAGFNTAILSEIGKRLKININLINVETGARTIALKSGRADVVFWLQVFTGYENFKDQPDIPEGVIVSTPYYGWNKVMLIGKKK